MKFKALAITLLLAAAPAFAAGVDGNWAGSIDSPNGAIEIKFSFKADGEKLTGNTTGAITFPGGTAYVFQYDTANTRPERRDDLIKIWYPNQTLPYLDTAARTVNVSQVYSNATPRYFVEYGQDPTHADEWGRVVWETVGDPANGVGGTFGYMYTTSGLPTNIIDGSDPIEFRTVAGRRMR